MLRNVASQKWRVYAWDATTGLPKTGDAANITAVLRIDDATDAMTDTNPTEVDATNEKGYYEFAMDQAETNGAKLSLAPQSVTANIVVIACPPVIYTVPQYHSLYNVASDGDFAGNVDGTVATTSTVTDGAKSATALSTAVWTGVPAGFIAATFPTGTIANTTNITAGTITTTTNLTTLPTITTDWLTAAGLATDAVNEIRDAVSAAVPSSPEIADAVLQEIVADHAAIVGSLAYKITMIEADTNELQTDDYPTSIAAIQTVVDKIPLSDGVISWNATALAAINAEVVDTLTTDTYAEPGQATPAATSSLAAKIGYLFKAWRNRSNQTATTYQLFNDDAATVDQKATVSDDATTAEKGEVITGP